MYRKIDTRIWDDPKFQALSLEGQHLFIWLFTNSQSHVGGLYYCVPEVIPRQAKLKGKALARAWVEVIGSGMVKKDGRLVWVVNMMPYQGRGVMVYQAVIKHVRTLHPSKLIPLYFNRYSIIETKMGKGVVDGILEKNRDTPNQEQYQEQYQEQEQYQLTPEQPAEKPTDDYSSDFEKFWAYLITRGAPKPRGKRDAAKTFDALVASKKATPKSLCMAVDNYARHLQRNPPDNEKYILHGSTFLNGKWEDWAVESSGGKGCTHPVTARQRHPEGGQYCTNCNTFLGD